MSRPRQVSDEDIARAARACFLEHGPAVSVDTIADRLGVSGPAILRRVSSKDALLLLALGPPRPPPWLGELARGPSDDTPVADQLTTIVLRLLALMRDMLPALVVLRASGRTLRDIVGGDHDPSAEITATLCSWLSRAARAVDVRPRRDRRGDPDATARADLILSAVEARCFREYIGGTHFARGSDREFAARTVRTLLAQRDVPSKRTRR